MQISKRAAQKLRAGKAGSSNMLDPIADKEFQAKLVKLVTDHKRAGEENYVLRQAARILIDRSNVGTKESALFQETINMSEEVKVTLTAEFHWR